MPNYTCIYLDFVRGFGLYTCERSAKNVNMQFGCGYSLVLVQVRCIYETDFTAPTLVMLNTFMYYLGPNKQGLVTYIQENVYIGNTLLAELSKLTYVED